VQFDFIIKRDTGKTPTMWIEEKLANEIKKDLNDTAIPISKISENISSLLFQVSLNSFLVLQE
jgi:hypothetical protein